MGIWINEFVNAVFIGQWWLAPLGVCLCGPAVLVVARCAGRIGSLGCVLGAWVLFLLVSCVVVWSWVGCVCVCVSVCMGIGAFNFCFSAAFC